MYALMHTVDNEVFDCLTGTFSDVVETFRARLGDGLAPTFATELENTGEFISVCGFDHGDGMRVSVIHAFEISEGYGD